MIQQILDSMARANHAVADQYRHGLRDAHAKSHAILRGELRVHDDAPPQYRQGLFASAATYPVIVRLSTAPGFLQSDQVHAPQGFAIKVVGVDGERALPDGASTQDLLMVNQATLPFGTLDKYLDLQKILEKQPTMSDKEAISAYHKAKVARTVLDALHKPLPPVIEVVTAPFTELLGNTFHTMAALRYGDHIAKLSVAPKSANVTRLTGKQIAGDGDSAIRDRLRDFFADQSADFDVRAQLCTDLDDMPIEDAGALWDEDQSPHVSVATLHLPAQETYSNARRVYADDAMSFSPWHALAAHRPLGAIMRARRRAYPSSSDFRHDFNQVNPVEPTSIDELPD